MVGTPMESTSCESAAVNESSEIVQGMRDDTESEVHSSEGAVGGWKEREMNAHIACVAVGGGTRRVALVSGVKLAPGFLTDYICEAASAIVHGARCAKTYLY